MRPFGRWFARKSTGAEGKTTMRTARGIIEECKACEEDGDHTRLIELCNELLAEHRSEVDAFGIQERMAISLSKVGRYEEAMKVFRGFLLNHRQLGFPIASSKWMYHWLVAHHKGDERKAMDQFAHLLDEVEAERLLSETR